MNPYANIRADRDHHRNMSHQAMHQGIPLHVTPGPREIMNSIDALTHAVRALDLSVERIGQVLQDRLGA